MQQVQLGPANGEARAQPGLPLTDRADGSATHLLTVGHVLEEGQDRVVLEVDGVQAGGGAVVLDLLARGTDAAVVRLDRPLPAPCLPEVRQVTAPGPRVRVRADGPSLGWRRAPLAAFWSARRGRGYVVRDAIRVVPGRARPGDSGQLLWHAEQAHTAVGLLIGQAEGATVFAPLPDLMERVQRALGQELVLARTWATRES